MAGSSGSTTTPIWRELRHHPSVFASLVLRSPEWTRGDIDDFSASLTALSANTVSSYTSDLRGFAEWCGRSDITDPDAVDASDDSSIPGVPHDPPFRPADHRPQDRLDPPLLPLARRHGARSGRPDRRRVGSGRRRSAAARARPVRTERPVRRSHGDQSRRARVAATARRRRAGGALRIRAARQRAVHPHRCVAVARAARRHGLGQGFQGAAGPVERTGRRRAPGMVGTFAPTSSSLARTGPATSCSATSAASRSPRATCGESSTGGRPCRPTRTHSATASPPTCSTAVPTCAPCKSCSGTRMWQQRSVTLTSVENASRRPIARHTPEHEHRSRRRRPPDAVEPLAQAQEQRSP